MQSAITHVELIARDTTMRWQNRANSLRSLAEHCHQATFVRAWQEAIAAGVHLGYAGISNQRRARTVTHF